MCAGRIALRGHRRGGLNIRELVSRIREFSPLAAATAVGSPSMGEGLGVWGEWYSTGKFHL